MKMLVKSFYDFFVLLNRNCINVMYLQFGVWIQIIASTQEIETENNEITESKANSWPK